MPRSSDSERPTGHQAATARRAQQSRASFAARPERSRTLRTACGNDRRLLAPVTLSGLLLAALMHCGTLRPVAAGESTSDESTAVASASGLGQLIEGYELRDYRGRVRTLDELSDARLVVVVFLGTECPLAKLYAPRLAELHRQYGPRGVAFVGIDSNRQDSITEILHYARLHRLEFPVLKDVGNVVADQFGAQRTPEVFVLDEQRAVRYRGRIDDQYGFVGEGRGKGSFQMSSPRRQDLVAALDELLGGVPVSLPLTAAPGCLIGRVRESKSEGTVTWTRHIARVFQQHCQECHRPGQIAPFPLLAYEDAAGWADMIGEVVTEGRMPPWHADGPPGFFANDARLSEEERALILEWIEGGVPEGDPADMPPPREFADGWAIPHPDQIVYMSDVPFEVPAEGAIEYQWFTADPQFTEDKWIKMVEARPGNPAVVHHVTVYFHPPGMKWNLKLNERINLLGGFAPGKRPIDAPGWDGTARFVPAGSRFVFEMHYTSNGSVQYDRSSIALVFATPEEVRRQLSLLLIANNEFEIPPHADNHRVESQYTLDEDSYLYSMSPHMHLRGKSFRIEAEYPQGQRELLLDIPHFDFNWQYDYMLAERKRLPRGTTVHCVAHFDNSEANLANPDPEDTVRWGDQTWEEMMIGTIAIAPVEQDIQRRLGKAPTAAGEPQPRWLLLGVLGGVLVMGILAVPVVRSRWHRRELSRGGPRTRAS